MLFLHITDSRFVLLWILNIPAFLCGTHFDQSWWDPGTQKEISWQNKPSRNVSKLFQQLKNISSFKICDQSGCMTMWEGLKVLLALTWDILHSCWGIHLLWVMVNILNHAGRNLVWCQCGYSSPDCAPLCVCVPAPVLGACHSKGGFPQAPVFDYSVSAIQSCSPVWYSHLRQQGHKIAWGEPAGRAVFPSLGLDHYLINIVLACSTPAILAPCLLLIKHSSSARVSYN